MVSKVTLALLVLCVCLHQSWQFPDHNRTRRAELPSRISMSDLQNWFHEFTKLINQSTKGSDMVGDKFDVTGDKGGDKDGIKGGDKEDPDMKEGEGDKEDKDDDKEEDKD